MYDICIHKHPSIHCSVGSTPIHVGVQCPLTSSLGEFPGYYDWALACVGVHRLSLCLPYLGVFPFTLLRLPLNFIRVSSLRLVYLHPLVDLSLTHFSGEFPDLGLALGTDVVVPEAEQLGVRMKQKSRFKFRPWSGLEPRNLQSDGQERYH